MILHRMLGSGTGLCGLYAAKAVSFRVYVYLPSRRAELDLPASI